MASTSPNLPASTWATTWVSQSPFSHSSVADYPTLHKLCRSRHGPEARRDPAKGARDLWLGACAYKRRSQHLYHSRHLRCTHAHSHSVKDIIYIPAPRVMILETRLGSTWHPSRHPRHRRHHHRHRWKRDPACGPLPPLLLTTQTGCLPTVPAPGCCWFVHCSPRPGPRRI